MIAYVVMSGLIAAASAGAAAENHFAFRGADRSGVSYSPDKSLSLSVKRRAGDDIEGDVFEVSVRDSGKTVHESRYVREVSGDWSASGNAVFINYTSGSDRTGCDVLYYERGQLLKADMLGVFYRKYGDDPKFGRQYMDCIGWHDEHAVDIVFEVDHIRRFNLLYDVKSKTMTIVGPKVFH